MNYEERIATFDLSTQFSIFSNFQVVDQASKEQLVDLCKDLILTNLEQQRQTKEILGRAWGFVKD